MRLFFLMLLSSFIFISCGHKQQSMRAKIPSPGTAAPLPNEAVATFAEGCFWHTEIIFQSLAGVRDAVSGYAGGNTENPDYDIVSTGSTGHAEAVQVYYDTTKISYKELVDAFFASQDPTTANRQGNDVGTEYRSIAFYRNGAEKKIIEEAIQKLTEEKIYSDPIVTEVVAFTKFYRAEDHHQEYVSRNPGNPYVQNVSIPDYLAFRNNFKANYKP